MSVTTLSSREFNQDLGRAKRAAKEGPVFVTDRGKLSHVLLSAEEYQKLTSPRKNIADLLAMPGIADIELEIPRQHDLARSADFS